MAALDLTRSLPELDPAPIGIHAASEGEYVAPSVHGARAQELLERAPSSTWDVWVLPEANHGLMIVREGTDGEGLAPTRYAPELHPRLVEWTRRHLGASGSR